MPETLKIVVYTDGGAISHAVPLGRSLPLQIGRAPTNQLCLQDAAISWHHAQVWVESGAVWIRDLGSRNGTYVNDKPVTGPRPFLPGDRIRVGAVLTLAVEGEIPAPQGAFFELMVEDVSSKMRVILSGDRFHIGSGDDAHLRIEGARRVVTITVHRVGATTELWMGREHEEGPLEMGEVFTAGGRSLRVVQGTVEQAPTVEFDAHRYPYALEVKKNGRRGPEACLRRSDRAKGLRLTGNSAVLLYILADKIVEDRRRLDGDQGGWCTDQEVVVGIWGRSGTKNSLHVLLHRVRSRLEKEGFDPWFIEKTVRGVRARLTQVEVV